MFEPGANMVIVGALLSKGKHQRPLGDNDVKLM